MLLRQHRALLVGQRAATAWIRRRSCLARLVVGDCCPGSISCTLALGLQRLGVVDGLPATLFKRSHMRLDIGHGRGPLCLRASTIFRPAVKRLGEMTDESRIIEWRLPGARRRASGSKDFGERPRSTLLAVAPIGNARPQSLAERRAILPEAHRLFDQSS